MSRGDERLLINSSNNERVKELTKLKIKKYRDKEKLFLIEGFHLVQEAYKAETLVEVFTLEDRVLFDVKTTIVSVDVMKKLATTDTVPSIIGVARKSDTKKIIGDKILLLDGVQDPGNLGTIIRSAVAFDVSTIVLSRNTVDLYNPKVVRATQGMLFKINIVVEDIVSAIHMIRSNNMKVYGTDVVSGMIPSKLSTEEKSRFALVVGNEGNGLSPEVYDLCDDMLYIKMNNQVESLNVGVATSIILYEMGVRNE